MGWVKLTDQRALNRKLRKAGFAARGLDEAAICQVAGDMTDGHISRETVEMLAVAHGERKWQRLVEILIDVDRWTPAGDGWHIHDYLEYNPTKAEWLAEVEKKRAAGRLGGRARGKASAQARASTDAQATVVAFAQADPTRPDPTPTGNHPRSSSSSRGADPDEDPPLVHHAIAILAQRDLDATPATVGNPPSWLATARTNRRAQHHAEITRLGADGIARLETPEKLADWLSIAGKPAASAPTIGDCQRCDNGRWVPADDCSGFVRCPDCTPVKANA